jgi:redox-sensitive bicupin YhaK (pirin superfamily)
MSNDRRGFLGKLGLGVSAVLAWPFAGFAKNDSSMEPTTNNNQKMVREVKPLGFQWETADPFLFCVHHEDKFPKGNEHMGPASSLAGRHIGNDFIVKDGFRMYHGKKVPGFPGHPHRGFETITVVREGLVDHADSVGAAGRYGNGDVQWMTAGKGVQHSEMFPCLSTEKENPLELFQIWLNLPRKSKMVEPHFKMFWKEKLGKYKASDKEGRKVEVEVIAGKLGTVAAPAPPPDSWAADPKNEVGVWNMHLDPNVEWRLPAASAGVNRTLYFYQGEGIEVAGQKIPRYHSVEVLTNESIVIRNGNHSSKILVLQGRPIGEPVIQYGPFVMNSKQEIQDAFEDFHRTQFGGWPWPRYDQVHARNEGRFALHADGKKELPTG